MSDKELWAIQHSERIKGSCRFETGDSVTAHRIGAKYMTITGSRGGGKPQTVLDVNLTGSDDSLRFTRNSRRNEHPGSEKFQGEVRCIRLDGLDVLVGVLGREGDVNPNDDEDVEVFIATKTGNV